MGLVYIAVAGILLGGLVSFRRQGKPLAIQVVLALAVVGLLILALQTDTFSSVRA
jgi:hypothetical protein